MLKSFVILDINFYKDYSSMVINAAYDPKQQKT